MSVCLVILFSLFCLLVLRLHIFFFFFFNDTATTEIYTLSLHDALPISRSGLFWPDVWPDWGAVTSSDDAAASTATVKAAVLCLDRKSTRLNSSHSQISYAVFCLKKKKKKQKIPSTTSHIHEYTLNMLIY